MEYRTGYISFERPRGDDRARTYAHWDFLRAPIDAMHVLLGERRQRGIITPKCRLLCGIDRRRHGARMMILHKRGIQTAVAIQPILRARRVTAVCSHRPVFVFRTSA